MENKILTVEDIAKIKQDAIDALMYAMRYEFEGPRDIDSLEDFADEFVRNEILGE